MCCKECVIQKLSDKTSLRLTWSGSITLQGCSSCCVRWYFTVDGLECSIPVDGNIYQSTGLTTYRTSTISGYCSYVGGRVLLLGEHRIQFNVGYCTGWGSSTLYNAYTGYFNSRIIVEEIAPGQYTRNFPYMLLP